MKLAAVILAGGHSSRMGTDKGLMMVNGKPMVQHIIDAIHPLNIPTYINTNNNDYEQFGIPTFPDEISDKGPLGGICSSLKQIDCDKLLVVSCDTPFVTTELLLHLIESKGNSGVTMLRHQDREHPLIAIYNREVLPQFEQRLTHAQLRLREACIAVGSHFVDITHHPELGNQKIVCNLNTPEDVNYWNESKD